MQTTTLIYTSRSTQQVSMQVLKELAEQAARKNALVGITGLLLYGSGNFMQVLEGSGGGIERLYEKICKDTRHTNCQMLYTSERQGRLFPEWNMGQLNLDNAAAGQDSDWELISSTLSRSGAIDWKNTDPVLGWLREFMSHNRSGSSSAA